MASQLVWIEEGVSDLGVAGTAVAPEAIVQQLSELSVSLERGGSGIESVLIIGGPDVVPFYEAPNPAPYDGDATVPTDT